jgi:death on curing protein
MRIDFLSAVDALRLHSDQIAAFGGSMGVRDMGLLESALATPAASFAGQYLHDFPHEMASAYLFHIARNHPFVDGNKRTALACALLFLEINACTLVADQLKTYELVMDVAAGKADKAALYNFFKAHVRPT